MSANAIDAAFQAEHNELQLAINGLDYAPIDSPDNDVRAALLAEAAFLRGFTAFEEAIETLFVHYVTGGLSSKGFAPQARLQNCTLGQARTIIKADQRYIDWSSPSMVRERANRFFVSRQPFLSVITPRAVLLTEAEKIRNRIAHDSTESRASIRDVERSRFLTERTFVMGPGQLLRARRRGKPSISIGSEHLSTMAQLIHEVSHVAS